MPARNKPPYEQFGSYVLFKRLEADSLGELWRAGRIEGEALGATVALRRLTGGHRAALVAAASEARAIAPLLSGTSFAKSQAIEIVQGVPAVIHDYAGGRSLRHIVDRARGDTGSTPHPVPIDQAIAIAERISLSLATTSEMKYDGRRLAHGALIPQFVWISDDGEIRVAGQQLGRGIVASLSDPKVAQEIGRYFPPEYHAATEPSKTTDVYSLGAILFLLVTGSEPPDAANGSAFAQTIRAAKTMSGEPVPDDIRAVIAKSLHIDPAARYESVAAMRQELSALAHGGKYSATTFNLAFYLSSLLKKEMEGEAIEREKESKIAITPYIEALKAAPVAAAAAPAPPPAAPSMFAAAQQPSAKSRAPLAIAASLLVLAGLGAGAFFLLGSKTEGPAPASARPVAAAAVAKPAAPISQPVVVASGAVTDTATTATTATVDFEAARKKAFEEAVRQKLQEELMKLQAEYTRQLQQQQARNAPVSPPQRQAAVQTAEAAPSRAAAEEPPMSAAQFDQNRLAARQETPASPAPVPAPQTLSTQAPVQQSVQAPQQPAAPAGVREGDVVDITSLDAIPRPLSAIRPAYPPLAARQRREGTVLLTALISERGEVLDVKVLRGVGFGLDEAAVRAIRSTKFSPPMKEGKRVRTWYPQQVEFKM